MRPKDVLEETKLLEKLAYFEIRITKSPVFLFFKTSDTNGTRRRIQRLSSTLFQGENIFSK